MECPLPRRRIATGKGKVEQGEDPHPSAWRTAAGGCVECPSPRRWTTTGRGQEEARRAALKADLNIVKDERLEGAAAREEAMTRILEEARRIQDRKRPKVQTQTKSPLHLLIESEEETLNAIEDGFEKIECVIDSGAAESVAPSSIGRGYEVKGSEGSKRGQ